jgi:cytoskeleton protein RodZ
MASAGEETLRPATTAGALLRAAREAAGLSVDVVAQQLRLAPRQVTALEEDDYTHLPGRTFVRGFVRNYARFVNLDPDAVVSALPGGTAAPALAVPTLHQTAPTMGELPVTGHARPALARWAIPLTLAAIVVIAGFYEWLRSPGEGRPGAGKSAAPTTTGRPAAPPTQAPASPPEQAATAVPGAAPGATPAVSPPGPPATTSATPLPNPLATAPGPDDARLVLAFRDYSWAEVKDREGRVLLSRMNPGGTTQAVVGTPPFELVIGNAADVSITFRGQSVDLTPHARQNIARFTLR